jgi:hypothetical protein
MRRGGSNTRVTRAGRRPLDRFIMSSFDTSQSLHAGCRLLKTRESICITANVLSGCTARAKSPDDAATREMTGTPATPANALGRRTVAPPCACPSGGAPGRGRCESPAPGRTRRWPIEPGLDHITSRAVDDRGHVVRDDGANHPPKNARATSEPSITTSVGWRKVSQRRW